MNPNQRMVTEFHREFGFPIGDTPHVSPDLLEHRLPMLAEEMDELRLAVRDQHLGQVADALGDLLYLLYGAAVACGIDMDQVFVEIHRSNMSKTPRSGRKPAKGFGYRRPDILTVLRHQEGIG